MALIPNRVRGVKAFHSRASAGKARFIPREKPWGMIPFILIVLISSSLGAGEWKSADAGDFHLEWMVDGLNLNIKVTAPTEGWIAVGFNPTKKMKDANIIMGYVEDGMVVIEDHFGSGQISHRNDGSLGGSDDVMNKSGSERNGVTELSYTIPLNSGDPYDRVLTEGHTYKVILASHSKDKITMKHKRRTSMSITL